MSEMAIWHLSARSLWDLWAAYLNRHYWLSLADLQQIEARVLEYQALLDRLGL